MYDKGRAWIELDINNLNNNVNEFKRVLPKGCELMPAIKANAYGHGLVETAEALNKMEIYHFCVAEISEGIRLRKAGVKGEILILGYTHLSNINLVKKYDLTQTVIDYRYASSLDECKLNIKVHIKIDTGMHRLGEHFENITNIIRILSFKNIDVKGVFSHLCVSDSIDKKDIEFTKLQINHFNNIVKVLKENGYTNLKFQSQGSYGVLNYPDLKYDYARVGIALYGVLSKKSDKIKLDLDLKPVLSLKARVEVVRELMKNETVGYGLDFKAEKKCKIAVVSIGYADGISRKLSNNNGFVLINGIKVPIIARICMDQLFIDVSKVDDVKRDDEVVFIGQSGNEEISAEDMANNLDTITNEILSRLGERLKRIYKV